MNEAELELEAEAVNFASQNKKRIAREVASLDIFPADDTPVSVFMAGSPGAGKTEFSKGLLSQFEALGQHRILRIDPDDFRARFPGYSGSNSRLFQRGVASLVEKVIDTALHQKQSFILDGTMAKYEKAESNISRSLAKGRKVEIYYLYQAPEVAWKFTQAREVSEGRNIPKEAFINQFLESRNTVKKVLSVFDANVEIFLVKKDFDRNVVESVTPLRSTENTVDGIIGTSYTREDLLSLL